MTARLSVMKTGPLVLVEDHGRPGLAAVGVTRSGAADRAAYGLGARLVGNPAGAAALEVLLGGLVVRTTAPVTIALTGADCEATVDDRPVPYAAPVHLSGGQMLALGTTSAGLRAYVSVRGGIEVPAVLGSRSTDVLSGLGPAPLAVGHSLRVGPTPPAAYAAVDVAPVVPPSGAAVTLDLLAGPRLDWLSEPAALTEAAWTGSERSNRVGLRLEGRTLGRAAAYQGTELPSEGLVRGAVQVSRGGELVVFLADHPVTGGYPVVAVLTDAACDLAAQVRPGQQVRLRWTR